jgi:hypothetical protein
MNEYSAELSVRSKWQGSKNFNEICCQRSNQWSHLNNSNSWATTALLGSSFMEVRKCKLNLLCSIKKDYVPAAVEWICLEWKGLGGLQCAPVHLIYSTELSWEYLHHTENVITRRHQSVTKISLKTWWQGGTNPCWISGACVYWGLSQYTC